MITPAFIWLIASHITVCFPAYLGYKLNFQKWKPCIMILIFNAFFSSLYHWKDQDNFEKNFNFLGTGPFVHKYMDYYCSYLSFFITIFYTLKITNNDDISIYIYLMNLISVFLALISPQWYAFMIIIIFFMLIYLINSNKQIFCLIFNILKKKIFLFFLTVLFFSISMYMQYNLCVKYNSGFYYQIYHGIWHFFLFLSAGMCIILNKYLLIFSDDSEKNTRLLCCNV